MARPVTPLLAVDLIIKLPGSEQDYVLIERKNIPHGKALPGGFVDVGETCENAARREAKEETGLNVFDLKLEQVRDDPGRDVRGHTVSLVYSCRADNGNCKAGDDAKKVWTWRAKRDEMPADMCFDHADVLTRYLTQ